MDPMGLRASDDPAVVTGDGGEVSHRDLLDLMAEFSRALPAARKGLVVLLGDREIGTVAAYLATLREGHAVAWFGSARDANQLAALVRRYAPDVVVGPATTMDAVIKTGRYRTDTTALADVHVTTTSDPRPAPEVGPNTALLLLTSGSLSGGRAVRLSAESIAANTAAIAATLDLSPRSRAATALPLFYTYGLSVLNSHLSVGGSVLLTDAAASGGRFWRQFAEARCDTFAGVPLHYDWLARSRLPWAMSPGLRTMTVSGGRLRTQLARQFYDQCNASGRRFVKMYGQTEATARISILQHDDFPDHVDSVGQAVPGGRVTIETPPTARTPFPEDWPGGDEHPDTRVGRIVYHGAAAMQGYADSRADLAKPDQMRGRVDTGDMGYLDDGYLYLVGRDSRFIKPDGKRVGLDAVEDIFAEVAPAGAVASADGDRAHVFVESSAPAGIDDLRLDLLRQVGLSPRAIQVYYIDRLPRRPSGKIDYHQLLAQATDSQPVDRQRGSE